MISALLLDYEPFWGVKLPVPTQQLTALRTKERSSLALYRYLIATLVNQ